jgi:erythromycin esterase-like protein
MSRYIDLFGHDKKAVGHRDNIKSSAGQLDKGPKVGSPQQAPKRFESKEEYDDFVKKSQKTAIFKQQEAAMSKLHPKDRTQKGTMLIDAAAESTVSESERSLSVSNMPNQKAVSEDTNRARLKFMTEKFKELNNK